MEVIQSKEELQELIAAWRDEDEHVALVPTMGNLHQGHGRLVEIAREHAERVIVSVYVNPTQFGEGEDFEEYPRTLERDTRRLKHVGADVLFVPDDDTVYPFGHDCATVVSVPGLTENFCGAVRPGHFDGVTTVVARLFAIVQPEVAVFGQKDYQQQLVIRYMTEDLSLPIRIITAATVREDDGLAMSSRNAYLTDEERDRDFEVMEQKGAEELRAAGFELDYLAIRRAENLTQPDRDCDDLVVLAAGKLGNARLIDNVVVTV